MSVRRWRAENILVCLVVLLATGVAFGLSVLFDFSGWPEQAIRVAGWAGLAWISFERLRSDAPFDDHWFFHVLWAAAGVSVLVSGALEVVDPRMHPLLRLLALAAGVLMLAAAGRDLFRWHRTPRPERERRKPMSTGPKHLRPR